MQSITWGRHGGSIVRLARMHLHTGSKQWELEVGPGYKTSKLAPRVILPPAKLAVLKLPKQYHQLGTKYSNTWPREGHLSLKLPCVPGRAGVHEVLGFYFDDCSISIGTQLTPKLTTSKELCASSPRDLPARPLPHSSCSCGIRGVVFSAW
jgi:hypothetical protein